MNYNDTNVYYDKNIDRWNLVKDIIRSDVKGLGINPKTHYLPRPNPHDNSQRNLLAYDNYVKRAHFYNFTKPTENTIVGSIFKKEPTLISDELEFVINDIDGSGLSFYQQSKKCVKEIAETGRGGFFVDYTITEKAINKDQEIDLNARPIAIFYKATQILDWETSVINNRRSLSMVKLAEWRDDKSINHDRERVLELINGVFVVNVNDYKDGELINVETFFPTLSNGQSLDYISFQFVGGTNNDEVIDEALLYEMSTLNVAHYQSSADYEDFRFKLGQIQPFISGVSQAELDKNTGSKGFLQFGSGVAWVFGEGATAELLQAQPNSTNMESMKHKEEQARAIGAKLLDTKQGNMSATEAEIISSSESASILTIVSNVESAYRSVFNMMLDRTMEGEFDLEFSRQFSTSSLKADDLRVIMDGVFKGVLPDSILFNKMRQSGSIKDDLTDEDLRDLILDSRLNAGI